MENLDTTEVKAEVNSGLTDTNSFIEEILESVIWQGLEIKWVLILLVENVFIWIDILTVITDIPVLVCFLVISSSSENSNITEFKENSLSDILLHLASVIKIYKGNFATEKIDAVTKAVVISEILALMVVVSSFAFVSRAAWRRLRRTAGALWLGKCFSDSLLLGKTTFKSSSLFTTAFLGEVLLVSSNESQESTACK